MKGRYLSRRSPTSDPCPPTTPEEARVQMAQQARDRSNPGVNQRQQPTQERAARELEEQASGGSPQRFCSGLSRRRHATPKVARLNQRWAGSIISTVRLGPCKTCYLGVQ